MTAFCFCERKEMTANDNETLLCHVVGKDMLNDKIHLLLVSDSDELAPDSLSFELASMCLEQ
jgi:hypothetical protein